jgi:pilus assembly protein CpaB
VSGKFLVVVAIVLGAIVVVLLNSMISEYERKANPPTRTFYRATADVAPGITVADAMADASRLLVAEKNIPEGFAKAYPYAIDEFQMEYTRKRRISRPIKAGEFLVQEHLDPLSSEDIRLSIPEGHEAVAIGVNSETSVSYLVAPGDVVDVVLVSAKADPKVAGASVVEAKPIVTDVRVWAIDSLIGRKDGVPVRARGTTYSTVTVTASHEDAMKLLAAKQAGKLTLILKSKKPG